MACALTLDATLVSIPSQMIGVAKQDAWIGYLIAMLFPLTAWWMVCRVLSRFPREDLFSILIGRLRWLGRILTVAYLGFILIIVARDLRLLGDFIIIIMLQQTPVFVILLLTAVTMIFMVRGGIELLGRMTEVYQLFLVLVILLLPVLLAREIQWNDLRPFFESSMANILESGWYPVSYLGEIIILAFMFSSHQIPFRAGVIGLFLGVFLLELLLVFNLFVFGTELTPRLMFPNQETVREIRITDFLDRLDLPIVGIWIPAMIVKTAYSLYVICHGMKRLFPSVNPKALAGPSGIFVLSCSIWFFADAIQLLNWNRNWPVVALGFEWLIPVLLFLLLRPSNKAQEG